MEKMVVHLGGIHSNWRPRFIKVASTGAWAASGGSTYATTIQNLQHFRPVTNVLVFILSGDEEWMETMVKMGFVGLPVLPRLSSSAAHATPDLRFKSNIKTAARRSSRR